MIGILRKMSVMLQNPVQYQLRVGEENIALNALLGQRIQLRFTGLIYCIQCGRKTAKSFQQGYCFPCYRRLLECGLCIIHPEKCRYYEGTCKADDWAHVQCGQPQVVYLANSSGLKVGITRASSLTTRWIDQGATQGIAMFQAQNRLQAGLLEVALKAFVADKTQWRVMLQADSQPLDLVSKRAEVLSQSREVVDALLTRFSDEISAVIDNEITTIRYPVLQYPQKITPLNADKTPLISGILQGIKGQYLLLDSGVFSVRKFSGYEAELS